MHPVTVLHRDITHVNILATREGMGLYQLGFDCHASARSCRICIFKRIERTERTLTHSKCEDDETNENSEKNDEDGCHGADEK